MYVWMDYDRGMGPYRPQMTVILCTIPGPLATSDQTKRPYQVIYVCFIFVYNSNLKLLTVKFLLLCYRVELLLYLPDGHK